MNELRQCGFWIVSTSSAIRNLTHRCVVCRKLRGKLAEKKMSDIPKERISNDPPFTHCGADMFGPFTIKERVQTGYFGRRTHQVQAISVGFGKDKFALLEQCLVVCLTIMAKVSILNPCKL